MDLKEALSAVAIALTLFSFFPYIRDIHNGAIKPHFFSWTIWGATTCIAFLAQLEDDGGAGAWPIGISGFITAYIAVLAYFKNPGIAITRSDWAFLLAALSSLPLWYFTQDPLWAVVVLTTVDLLGFGPTLRRVRENPDEESAVFYVIFVVRNIIAMAALEHYSPTTLLFPGAIGAACLLLVLYILYRRKALQGG